MSGEDTSYGGVLFGGLIWREYVWNFVMAGEDTQPW